jgi:hypothetical protein
MPILEGTTTAAGLRFAIVVARFNDFVTERLRTGALDALTSAGVASEHMTTLRVPGASRFRWRRSARQRPDSLTAWSVSVVSFAAPPPTSSTSRRPSRRD